MYDIYAIDMEFEQCAPDKEQLKTIAPFAVIHYVLSGCGTINGKKVTAGSAFVSSINSYMDYYPDKNNPWSYIYVRLCGDGLKKAFDDVGFLYGTHIIEFSKHEELKGLLSLYQAIGDTFNQEGNKIIANALFMLHKQSINKQQTIGMQEKNAQMIKKYIDDNYYKKITILDISNHFYLSKNYIRNLFFDFFEISPKAYIQKKRMDRARELLIETDISISTVAHSIGYDDALLFSKQFSKQFSVSPRKYRQQNSTKKSQ